jgi:hypothetical protein
MGIELPGAGVEKVEPPGIVESLLVPPVAPGAPEPDSPGMPAPGMDDREGRDMMSVCCWASAVAIVPSATPRASAKVLVIANLTAVP